MKKKSIIEIKCQNRAWRFMAKKKSWMYFDLMAFFTLLKPEIEQKNALK